MKSLYDLLRRSATANPRSLAVLSPNQTGRLGESLSYSELASLSTGLASYLKSTDVTPGSVVVSDLPNITENLVLQLACSQLGAAYATVKDNEGLTALNNTYNVVGCVPTSIESWLITEFDLDEGVILLGTDFENNCGDWMKHGSSFTTTPSDDDRAHAYFNSTKALNGSEIVDLGQQTSTQFHMTDKDRVCVSITLCHSFGIASGVGSIFTAGAGLVLPAVGGIKGCGIPSERAIATLQTLTDTDSTLLLADTHIVKNFPEEATLKALRGGIVKTGSGSTFLKETVSFAGVDLITMGKV